MIKKYDIKTAEAKFDYCYEMKIDRGLKALLWIVFLSVVPVTVFATNQGGVFPVGYSYWSSILLDSLIISLFFGFAVSAIKLMALAEFEAFVVVPRIFIVCSVFVFFVAMLCLFCFKSSINLVPNDEISVQQYSVIRGYVEKQPILLKTLPTYTDSACQLNNGNYRAFLRLATMLDSHKKYLQKITSSLSVLKIKEQCSKTVFAGEST